MTDRPLRVGVWAAVSSKEQAADDKSSLDDQLKAGADFAAALGGQVVARYTTAHSRDVIMWSEAESEMASYRAFREDVQAHRIDLIWMLDPDRAGRDPALSEQLYSLARKNNVEVYVSTSPHPVGQQSPGHRYLFSIQATRAGEDQALRKHRFASGMRGRVLKRGLHPGHWPLGYAPVRDGSGKVMGAEPDGNAPAVLEVTRLFLAGHSIEQITARMNAGPFRPMFSSRWHTSTVRKITRNDAYGGLLVWRGEKAAEPSAHFPPLWNALTFAAVVRERQRRARGPYHRTGAGPYSGVAFCASCGGAMYRFSHHRNKEIHYLDCGAHHVDRGVCGPNHIAERLVTVALGEAMAVLCNQTVLDATLARLGDGAALDGARADLARATGHVTDLEAQRLRLAHALAAGKMQSDVYYAVDGDLSAQLGAERLRIVDLQHIIAAQPDQDTRRETLVELVGHFGDVIGTLEPALVAALLQRAGIRVMIAGGAVAEIVIG